MYPCNDDYLLISPDPPTEDMMQRNLTGEYGKCFRNTDESCVKVGKIINGR